MIKSERASLLLGSEYWVTAKAYCYSEDRLNEGFSLYVPPGYLIEYPLLAWPLTWLFPARYMDCIIMLYYLEETRSLLYKRRPFAIEERHIALVFTDMLRQRHYPKICLPLIQQIIRFYRPRRRLTPVYLLRKNAVEFYLRKKAKDDTSCA